MKTLKSYVTFIRYTANLMKQYLTPCGYHCCFVLSLHKETDRVVYKLKKSKKKYYNNF